MPAAPQFMTMDDLVKLTPDGGWLWPGWIREHNINLFLAARNTGKTRFTGDLVRRIHNGLPWPDGQEMTLPKDSVPIWIPGDGCEDQIKQLAEQMGFNLKRISPGSFKDKPYHVNLDTTADIDRLRAHIRHYKSPLVILDTLLAVTRRNLCAAEEVTCFFEPLMLLAKEEKTTFVVIHHQNKDGKGLGLRVEERARVIFQMEAVNPGDRQCNQRRLWVEHNRYQLPPPPLLVTMHTDGNEYLRTAWEEPDRPPRAGRTPERLEEAIAFVRDKLTEQAPHAVSLQWLIQEASDKGIAGKNTILNAGKALGVKLTKSGKFSLWSLPDADAT